jgi:hypothetical protein
MNKYIMIYCMYDPAHYMGHRISRFEASNMEEAEKKAHEIIEKIWVKGNFEYQLSQYIEETSYRIYDNKKHRRG